MPLAASLMPKCRAHSLTRRTSAPNRHSYCTRQAGPQQAEPSTQPSIWAPLVHATQRITHSLLHTACASAHLRQQAQHRRLEQGLAAANAHVKVQACSPGEQAGAGSAVVLSGWLAGSASWSCKQRRWN